jgi:tetratricopeptide (TPR) repeat protein
MGRKKKKHHKAAQKAKTLQPLDHMAAEHLSAGRFRQAIDAFKELFKTAPETHRPHLLTAYDGLFNQRMEKGMLQEAGMVLDQMEKLAGNVPFMARIRLLLKSQKFAAAAEVAAIYLASCDTLPEAHADLAADALVTAFEEMPRLQVLPPAITDDLARIQSALKAVCEQGYAKALLAIKPIGLRSIFISWKWLVKGLCALYTKEDEKALAAFGKIATGSTPESYASAYLRLLSDKAPSDFAAQPPAVLEAACAAAGFAKMAKVIARAEYLWRVKRFRDSHAHLIGAMEEFPSLSAGLGRTLSELYYNACFEMPFEPGQKYVRHLLHCAFDRKAGTTCAEQIWAQRSAALFMEAHSTADRPILEQWEKFLSLHAALHGERPKVCALIYNRLGNLFCQPARENPLFSFLFNPRKRARTSLRNPEMARRCFEKSVKADPGDKTGQLSLIGFYEKIGAAPKVNRLLDQMIKQFPGEKDVLFKAGQRCVARKAFVKAISYLEQALALDPMDKSLREALIIACIQAALNHVHKGQVKKARLLLPRVIEASDEHSDDFNRGRAFLYARWAALEQLNGDPLKAAKMWDQAMAHRQSSELRLHFFYWIMASYYGVESRLLKDSEGLIGKVLKKPASAAIAVDLVDILSYIRGLSEPLNMPAAQMGRIDRYIGRAAASEMTRDQAKAILHYALLDDPVNPVIAATCVGNMLKRNPDDAFFRYYRYLSLCEDRRLFGNTQAKIKELTALLQLAREQKETAVALEIQKRLNQLEEIRRLEETRRWDDDDDDDDEDDEYPFGELDDEDEDEMDEEELEALLDKIPLPWPSFPHSKRSKAKPTKPPKKKKPPSGPQQLDLF